MNNYTYKDKDLNLVLIYPWKGKILINRVLLRIYYENGKSVISNISYRKLDDPSKWYSKVGKINEYVNGKILTFNDEESINKAIEIMLNHLNRYRADTKSRLDRNRYTEIIYNKITEDYNKEE